MAAKNKFMNAMKMPAIADMFSSEADRQRESGDLVTEVPLSELHPFVNHPFEVRDDEDMHSIEAALSDDASFPDGKIEPGFLDRYANRIVKSNNRYIWMLQLVNVQQIMPIQSERQPIAMVTYKSGVPYDIEQEQTGKQDKESAGPDCATICRPQDFFLNMSRTKRKRKLVEWLESCQENQVNVLDEKIPLLSFAVDFVTAYEYQKARGIKIHPGLWKDMRVDIFLVKKEN